MNNFQDGFPGRLVKIPEGIFAFVPDPLPPPTLSSLDMEIAENLSKADRALGELKGKGSLLPNPYFLIGPLQQREALHSSRLEGTYSSAEELILADADPNRKPVRSEIGEVHNYIQALEYGLDRLQSLPVSKRLIREVHKHLMANVRGEEKRPGEFRKAQNHIGVMGESVELARFVPPPVREMEVCLDDLDEFIHLDNNLLGLVKLALVHYQFEAIHPFMDGNGRIGRLMIALLLCNWGLLDSPLLYMSSYFTRYEKIYKDSLLNISQKGAWTDWIRFFLRGVAEQSVDAIKRADLLLELLQQYRIQLGKIQVSNKPLILIDELFKSPWTTATRVREQLDVTTVTAQKSINKLVEAGILREVTGRPRGRIYIAPGILEIIEKDSLD